MRRPSGRIGLFGGTFDPIHNGHIKAAIQIKDVLSLDRIYFIPAYISPFKTHEHLTAPEHRLEMIKRAIAPFPQFLVSEFELNKKDISYTIHTIKYYKNLFPHDTEGSQTRGSPTQLYLILGSDAFLGISKWKDVKEIFANTNIAVVTRPGYPLKHQMKRQKYRGQIHILKMDCLDISSSQLREKITQGKEYSSFVPSSVKEYIQKYHLYGSKKD